MFTRLFFFFFLTLFTRLLNKQKYHSLSWNSNMSLRHNSLVVVNGVWYFARWPIPWQVFQQCSLLGVDPLHTQSPTIKNWSQECTWYVSRFTNTSYENESSCCDCLRVQRHNLWEQTTDEEKTLSYYLMKDEHVVISTICSPLVPFHYDIGSKTNSRTCITISRG